jgi:hypothetical protein
MARLEWDSREYASGVDRGVFYDSSNLGEVWNGLTAVQESPSGDNGRFLNLDGIKIARIRQTTEFAGRIEAITWPETFDEQVLAYRLPKAFGLSYRTMTAKSYQIHIVYNVLLAPSSINHAYSDLVDFSWDFTTFPVKSPGGILASHFVIDAGVAWLLAIKDIEDILYGDESGPARLPDPDELFEIFANRALLVVTDHGDGSFTVTGPDEAISMLDPTTFEITWPSAIYIGPDTYKISSL